MSTTEHTGSRATQISRVLEVSAGLRDQLSSFSCEEPVTHVYAPLRYAWQSHRSYVEKFAGGRRPVVLVGMNPGPFGMAQTGVPFGDVSMVRDWMGIEAVVDPVAGTHPKRPILGFSCPRSEVSGSRLWGWARDRFARAEDFFERAFVVNYCPLLFVEDSGRNRTPDKLLASERERLFVACDGALRTLLQVLQPRTLVGVGGFAAKRCGGLVGDAYGEVVTLLHPSPASPKANRGWAKAADQVLGPLLGA